VVGAAAAATLKVGKKPKMRFNMHPGKKTMKKCKNVVAGDVHQSAEVVFPSARACLRMGMIMSAGLIYGLSILDLFPF